MNNSFGGGNQRPIISSMNEVSGEQVPSGAQMPSIQAPIISSGGGDIYLPATKAKGGKKIWILIAGIIAVLLVAAIAVLLVTGNRNSGGGRGTTTNYQESFNRYANYLVSGEVSTAELSGDYDGSKVYEIERAVDNNDVNYMSILNGYWNDFVDRARSGDKTQALEQQIQHQGRLMKFITQYTSMAKHEREDLIKSYLTKGKDNTIVEVNKEYDLLIDEEYEYSKLYAEAMKAWTKAAIDMYGVYIDAGCVSNTGELNAVCVNTVEVPIEIWQAYEAAEKSEAIGAAEDVVQQLVNNCYNMAWTMEASDEE